MTQLLLVTRRWRTQKRSAPRALQLRDNLEVTSPDTSIRPPRHASIEKSPKKSSEFLRVSKTRAEIRLFFFFFLIFFSFLFFLLFFRYLFVFCHWSLIPSLCRISVKTIFRFQIFFFLSRISLGLSLGLETNPSKGIKNQFCRDLLNYIVYLILIISSLIYFR